ncbi:MAG TPA: tetratricopeptide repeat protein [Streptosporangiaceae bacterium]|nr:tetratricopeptide repeat protein [Streptosporangiaceae bacterium]
MAQLDSHGTPEPSDHAEPPTPASAPPVARPLPRPAAPPAVETPAVETPEVETPAVETPAPGRGATFFGETRVAGDAVAGDKYVIAAATATQPGQLPRDDPCFRGRRAVLGELDALLTAATGEGVPLVIVVQGMPGVGKTALAVHWAHHIAARFPDGQLFVDLRGHSSRAVVTPPEALSKMLRALGVPGEQLPDDDDAQAALFRSHLADRRMLVILDNAASSDQVHPLLPASPRCVTIVTSRNRLPGLIARGGVHTVDLDVMPPDEAVDLVAAIVGAEQTSAHAEAAAKLAVRCAYLPLALRIAAANQKVRPHDTLADTVRGLEGGDRLSALALDEDPKQSAVRTAFDLSYRDLTEEQKRAFCLLGLVEGPDFGEAAVAALLGAFPEDAQRVVRSLTQANLVEQVAGHRYRLHDLLREYARERIKAEDLSAERDAAVPRLLAWLLATAQDAARRINPHRRAVAAPGAAIPRTADLKDALTWFEDERGVLVAATGQALAAGLHRQTWQLADAMFEFLDLRTYNQDNLYVHRLGYQAADLTDDAPARAVMLSHMAVIFRALGRYDRAVQVGEEALRLYRELGDAWGEAESLDTLAAAQWHRGRFDQVRELISQALPIRQRIGDRVGEANCLHDLARVHRRIGRCDVALCHELEALDVRQELGDLRGEVEAYHNLSRIYCHLGLYGWALRDARRALAGATELGDQRGRARALSTISDIHRRCGDAEHAQAPAEEALRIQRRIGDGRGEGVTRDNLARFHLVGGRVTEALEHARLALEADPRRHDPYDRAHKLHTLGLIHARLGDADEAMRNFAAELALLTEIGAVRGTAATHSAMAEVCVEAGRAEEGLRHARMAIDIEREFRNPFAIGRRLQVAARLAERVHGAAAAAPYHDEAARLLTDHGPAATASA